MSNDSKDELTLRIGEKLTAARIESGYTQSRAARAVGTSQSCISAVEHGKKQNVNIIIALIKLYGVSYEDVFGLVKVREKDSALGCLDEGSELLRELIKDSGIKGLETQTDMAVKICTYMLLRKLYSENPHRILGMAGKKVNRLEVSVGKNPELRAFIKECEHILLACT